MRNSVYDYKNFIDELNEDLEIGNLTPTTIIQILRAEKPVIGEYRPIVDWYYKHLTMIDLLAPGEFDSPEDLKEKRFQKTMYDAFRKYYETITVQKCLAEMYEMEELI